MTVIVDSFREALSSRVLWVLGIVWTVILLALIPISVNESRATGFQRRSVTSWSALLEKIKSQAKTDTASPRKQVWNSFSDAYKQQIEKATKDGQLTIDRRLIITGRDELNKLLTRRDFYDEASFKNTLIDDDARELIQQGVSTLSDEDLAYLNRMLIRAAFPFEISGAANKEITIGYFGLTSSPVPLTREQAKPFIESIVAEIMNLILGFAAVFIGILVTASFIPKTFESGAIDLLLSKPISRPLLFLAKFFGGCVFVLLNAVYFIIGLWLILGIRLQVWNHRMLLCIPLFLLSFSVYYSISAMAGVKWKNAIVSVVITIVFWAACFFVGTTKEVMENFFVNPQKIVKLVPVDDTVLAVQGTGEVVEWIDGDNAWDTILAGGPRPPGMMLGNSTVGPVYDSERKQLLYLDGQFPGRRFMAARSKLSIGTRDPTWKKLTGPQVPVGTRWIFHNHQRELIFVGANGIFRLKGDPLKASTGTFGFFNNKTFESLGPRPGLRIGQQFSAAVNRQNGHMALFSEQIITTLKPTAKGQYERIAERKLPDTETALLSFNGDTVMLTDNEGHVAIFDASTLKVVREFRRVAAAEPYMASAGTGGRWFAVLFHDGTLWLYDSQKETGRRFATGVSAAAFNGHNLLVADRYTRVIEYECETRKQLRRMEPALDGTATFFMFLVKPLHTIFPKPRELAKTAKYAVTSQETAPMGPAQDLQQARIKIDVWSPVWNSLIFEFVLLLFTCVYISRADL